MKVREATLEDKYDFVLLAKQFLKESKYPFKMDLESLFKNYEAALKHPDYLILLMEHSEEGPVGMLVGGANSPLFSSDKVASELAWFVSKDYRGHRKAIELTRSYEKWAKEVGCSHIIMAEIDTLGDMSKFYTRLGYKLIEKSYMKEV